LGLTFPSGRWYVAKVDPHDPKETHEILLVSEEEFAAKVDFSKAGFIDGLDISAPNEHFPNGVLFASGPGGLYVIKVPETKDVDLSQDDAGAPILAFIDTSTFAVNAHVAPDGFLYITGGANLFRIKLADSIKPAISRCH